MNVSTRIISSIIALLMMTGITLNNQAMGNTLIPMAPLPGPNDTIKGQIVDSGDPLDTGKVTLWRYDSSMSKYRKVDSTGIGSNDLGNYAFGGLQSGKYIIHARPDTSSWTYGYVVPGYYPSALSWKNAGTIVISDSGKTYRAEVELPNITTQSGGPGTIRGTITQSGPGKRKGPGDPQGGIEVLVMGKNNDPEGFDFTNKNGEYEISNLAVDTYKVRVEIPSYEAPEVEVIVDTNNSVVDTVNFGIDKNDQKVVTSIPEPFCCITSGLEKFEIYPNPVKNNLKVIINLRSEKEKQVQIHLWNSEGKLIRKNTEGVNRTGIGKFDYNISDLDAGYYILGVKSSGNSGFETKKIIKLNSD